MSKSREERYSTAQQFADDLRRFLEGKPSLARRPTITRRTLKWVSRHRLLASFVAALVVFTICLSFVATLLLGATARLAAQKQVTEAALVEAEANFRQYQSQLAIANNHLALLQHRTGQAEQAEAAFLKALQLQEEILNQRPGDEGVLGHVATTLDNLSYFYGSREPAKALPFYKRALDARRRLVELDDSVADRRRNLAVSYSNFGTFLAKHHGPQQALPIHERAVLLLQPIWEDSRGPEFGRDLAVAFNNLGMTYDALGESDKALTAFREALTVQTKQAEPSAATASDLSRLGGVHNNLGMVLESQQRWAEAARSYATATKHQQAAADRAPHVGQFRELISQHQANYRRAQAKLDSIGSS